MYTDSIERPIKALIFQRIFLNFDGFQSHVASEKITGRANHSAVLVNNDTFLVCGGEDDDLALGDTWIGKVKAESVSWQRIAESSASLEPRKVPCPFAPA